MRRSGPSSEAERLTRLRHLAVRAMAATPARPEGMRISGAGLLIGLSAVMGTSRLLGSFLVWRGTGRSAHVRGCGCASWHGSVSCLHSTRDPSDGGGSDRGTQGGLALRPPGHWRQSSLRGGSPSNLNRTRRPSGSSATMK